ncbi:zinc ribbon-containing protein [Trichloromonas sp.]|uniref:zinc ribbon-containing protein n=1 Tax=Trichloromonas sp. TaxID=3069249 RepID=UPI002A464561|nr:hypothetical protein [Trichloromonas sp.]
MSRVLLLLLVSVAVLVETGLPLLAAIRIETFDEVVKLITNAALLLSPTGRSLPMTDEKRTPEEEHEDVGLYQKLAARTAELVDEGRKTLDEALKKAGEEIAAGGEYTREQAERIGEFLRRDLSAVGKKAQQARDAVLEAVEPSRVAAGVQSGLARLLASAADRLNELAEKSEQSLEYKTGEVTSPGTLTCKECGQEMHLKSTTRIPPCPHCHKTLFRKSY